jgi:hypothetical protein
VSDPTTDAVPDEPVNLSKPPTASAGGTGKGTARRLGAAQAAALPTGPTPTLPLTMKLAFGAIVLQIVAGLVRAVTLRGDTAQFERWLVSTNKKAKKPKSPYDLTPGKGLDAVTHDLHTVRSSALLQAVVVGIALIVLLIALRRVRSASMGRIALIVITVLTQGPLYVIPTSGWPSTAKTISVIFGLASILSVVLLVIPQSSAYFRACKAIVNPGGTAAKSGLGAMFGGGRGAATGGAGAAATRGRGAATTHPANARATSRADAAAARSTAKAKARVDEAAVARGAELARTRAKAASKSRKREV